MAQSVKKLARMIAEQSSQYQRQAITPQLDSSSLEDGALQEYDSQGRLVGVYGKQWDDSHMAASYGGPTPPVPVAPTLESGPRVLTTRWSGKFENDFVSTMDHKHVAAYAGLKGSEVFKHIGTISGELGDTTTTALEPGTYVVHLVAWTLAGKHSAPSAASEIEVLDSVDTEAIQDAVDSATEDLAAADTAAQGRLDALEGWKTTAGNDLIDARSRLSSAESTLAPLPAAVDKARTDAVSEAATDATNKANAARTGAEATANALPKVLHGTTAPSGAAPDGSVWFQHLTNLSGAVIGQWNRVGGAWVSTPIRTEAIANVDVGKLTAGTAAVTAAVVQKFVAGHATILSGEMQTLTVTQKAVFAQAFAESIWAELGVFGRLQAQSAWIAGTMLQDGVVSARNIVASEELTAKTAQFLKVGADKIDINNLVASTAFIQAFEASSARFRDTVGELTTTVDGSGLTVSRVSQDSGAEVPIIYVGGNGETSVATYNNSGMMLGGLTADGSLLGSSLAVDSDPVFMGTPMIGETTAAYMSALHGETPFLENMPWGLVAWVDRSLQDVGAYAVTVQHRFLQLNAQVRSDRMYQLHVQTGHLNPPDSCTVHFRIHRGWGTDAEDPNNYSELMEIWGGRFTGLQWNSLDKEILWSPPKNGEVRLLLTAASTTHAWSFVSGGEWRKMRMWMQDLGPLTQQSGHNRAGYSGATAGTGGTGSTENDSPPVAVVEKTTGWSGTAGGFAGYFDGGVKRVTRGEGTTMMKQGRDPYWTAGGRQSSLFWWGAAATSGDDKGRSMASALSGATVLSGSLSIRGQYSPPVRGGTNSRTVHVYWHNHTGAPSFWAPNSTQPGNGYVGAIKVAPGQRVNMKLPRNILDALKAGEIKGFGFYTVSDYWGDAVGVSWEYGPALSITYKK